jgi:hypothetical protein
MLGMKFEKGKHQAKYNRAGILQKFRDKQRREKKRKRI